jgi:hypothetical protein
MIKYLTPVMCNSMRMRSQDNFINRYGRMRMCMPMRAQS